MKLFLYLSILALFSGCKKEAAVPPPVCYVCTTTKTDIITGQPVKVTITVQETCNDIAMAAIMDLYNKAYTAPGNSSYLSTKCPKKP